jgi:phage FluMu protein Com
MKNVFLAVKESTEKPINEQKYVVNVGNIGNIACDSKEEAEETFKEYVEQSKSGYGRAAGESVYLMVDGEPEKEYIGDNVEESKVSESTKMKCIECGASFKKKITQGTAEVKCPKCGGYDTEVDESKVNEVEDDSIYISPSEVANGMAIQELVDLLIEAGYRSQAIEILNNNIIAWK